nr:unnamed protein product [Callosobruchus analis]
MRMVGIEEAKASTPNLRRRSLFNQAEISSSSSPLALIERNADDDEEERRMHRAQAARRSILADQSMTERGDRRSFSDSYIMNEFTVCAQLFNENKITVKNAWNLRIIEILKPLCHRPAGKDLLQIAGTSLEICTKVFAIRVDDLHARGMRLANAMARVAANHEADNGSDVEEDGGGEGEEGDQPAKTKTKKRRAVNLSGPKRTITSIFIDLSKAFDLVNRELLLEKLQSYGIRGLPLQWLDPADISNRVKADFGNIESLCTLTFAMNSKNCTFVLLSADIVDMDKPEEDDDMIDFEQVPIKLIPKTCKIMLPFRDFQFNKENPANRIQPRTKPGDPSEIPPVQLDGTINDPFLQNDDIFDAVAEAERISGPHLVDKERSTIFGPQEKEQAQLSSNVNTMATTLTSTGQSKLGDAYNFDHIDISTGMIIDKVWAGPAHWKLKNVVHTAKQVFTGRKDSNTEKRARRKRKEPCVVNLDIVDDIQINFNKKVPPKPRKTLPEYKLFLPKIDDRLMHYLQNMQRMDELFIKPGTYASDLKRMWERHLDMPEEDPHADDGFDNSQFIAADDNMPDFDNGADNGDAMDCDANGGVEGSEHLAAEHENLRDNLVEAPQMVETEYVPYATKAKQMNMKRLKQAIWQHLTQSSEILATQPGERRTGKVRETTFAALYSFLPEVLTGKDKSNLSCPLAFVALLHLANEENLHFKLLNGENNFTIKRSEGG